MILYINTTPDNLIEIGLKNEDKFIDKIRFNSPRSQAEKLLPGIAKLLRAHQLEIGDLKSIAVANRGGSFTALRIGVVTANSLGYALKIPVKGEQGRTKKFKSKKLNFDLIIPEYGSRPKITIKKNAF